MKTAFLFAGQGAQTLGMAHDLYDMYPVVRETFDRAKEVLGYDIRQLIDHDVVCCSSMALHLIW